MSCGGGFLVLLEISPGEWLEQGEICAYLQFTCACARAEPGLLSAAMLETARQGEDNEEVCLCVPDIIVSMQKCPLISGARIGFQACNVLKNPARSVSAPKIQQLHLKSLV